MPQVKVIQPLSEPSKKLRVAAYARVSSDSADQLNSFATQVDYYTGYIQSKDEWEFAGLYADEAISGITADKRSDFQRLLVDCHAGKIDLHSCQVDLAVCTKYSGLYSNGSRAETA